MRDTGVAERWVGSCRRDLLDHIMTLNARHLERLLAAYKEPVASHLYQIHLYHWLEANDYGRFLPDNDL